MPVGSAQPSALNPVLTPGSWLNHYQIVRQIGAGGMGEVYEAEDTRLKRRVALKLLPPDLTGDPASRTRFEREAQAVAALNHPNIVTIYSIEESAGTRFLTMEIIEGRTIASFRRRVWRLLIW
jgi:serine/threonine-protein kinase